MKISLIHILIIIASTLNSLAIDPSDKEISKDFLTKLKDDINQDASITLEIKDKVIKILDEAIKNLDSVEKNKLELEKTKIEISSASEEINTNIKYASTTEEQSQQLDFGNYQLSQLLSTLVNLESEKQQKDQEYEKLLSDLTNRDENLKRLIQRATELKRIISELQNISLATPEIASQPPIIAEANKILNITKLMNFESELELINFNIDNYDIKTKLLTSRLDKCRAELQTIEEKIKYIKEEIDNKKREEIETTIKKSIEVLNSLPNFKLNLIPELSTLAEENIKLAKERQSFSLIYDKTNLYKESLSTYQQKLRSQIAQFENLKSYPENKKVDLSLRFNLKQVKLTLPKISELKEIKRKVESDLAEVEKKYSALLLKRAELADIEKRIQSAYQQISSSFSPVDKKKIKKGIDDIIKTHREILSSLISDYEAYILVLTDTLTTVNNWIQHTKEFISFIDENMMWIRTPFPDKEEVKLEIKKLAQQLTQIPQLIYNKRFISNLLPTLIVILFLSIFLLLHYRYLGGRLINLCPSLRTPLNFNIINFGKFLFCFSLRTLLIPLGIIIVADLIEFFISGHTIIQIIKSSLLASAVPTFLFLLIVNLIKNREVSSFVLGFYNEEFTRIYKKIFILGTIALLTTFITTFSNQFWLENQSNLADLIFRITQTISLPLGIIILIYLISDIKKLYSNEKERKFQGGSYLLLRNFLIIIIGILAVLFIMQILGYTYAVYELESKILSSLLIAFITWITYSFLIIITNYYKWRISFQHSIQVQSKSSKERSEEESTQETLNSNTEETSYLLNQINKGIFWISLISCILVVLYIWADIFPALGYFQKINLWETSSTITTVQTQSPSMDKEQQTSTADIFSGKKEFVTLWDLVLAMIIFGITLFLFKNIGFYLDFFILKRTDMEEGEKYAFMTILEYLILIVGIVMALSTIKVTWSKVQWLIAALGVGFGFGLQEIVANFVSGLILLFERPIRVGDIVTIGDISGQVKALRMRSTSIVNWENKELIVPNKEILSQKFINWTRENPIVRLNIPIGVSYKSDINKVIEILNQIAKSHPFVEHTPPPKAYFMRFGSSALECELRVYTKTSYFLDLQHDLLCTIFNRFNKEGIEISYPQMDVHIKTPLTICSPQLEQTEKEETK